MLGIEALPALIYLILTFFIPDTPRWQTLFQNNDKAAIRTLRQIYDDDQKAESVLNQIKSVDVNSINNEKLIAKTNNKIIVLAFLISFFNQLSVNFILYYASNS